MLTEIMFHQGCKYAIRSDASKTIIQFILSNGGSSRKVYNLYVESLYNYLEKNGYVNGPIKGYKSPEVTEFKKAYPFLKKADSLGLANTKSTFDKSVARFNEQENQTAYGKSALRRQKNKGTEPTFRDLKGMPKFHSKKEHQSSYTTNKQTPKGGQDTIRLKDGMLHVPKLDEDIPLLMHYPLPDGAVIKNVTLGMEPDGSFYASISVEYTRKIDLSIREAGLSGDMEAISKLKFLGLDYSQQDFYVDNNGERANYPKYYRKAEAKLAKLQKELSRMEKDSKNYERQLRKVQKLHTHIANQRKDFLQKLSTTLVRMYDVIVVEDIDLRTMSQTLKLAKNLEDNGFGMFRTMLAYKLERKGSLLVKVPRFYPSSKTCSHCGHIEPSVVLGVSEWVCQVCGTKHNRDHNAAINIRQKGIEIFAEYCTNWQAEKEKSTVKAAALKAGRQKKKSKQPEATQKCA